MGDRCIFSVHIVDKLNVSPYHNISAHERLFYWVVLYKMAKQIICLKLCTHFVPNNNLYIASERTFHGFDQILCRALGGKTGRAVSGWDIGITTINFSASSKLSSPVKTPAVLSVIECHRDEVCSVKK